MIEYSFKKGLWKGVQSGLIVIASIIAMAGFADFTIWQLLEEYLKPVIGSVSVGAFVAIAINYAKIRAS